MQHLFEPFCCQRHHGFLDKGDKTFIYQTESKDPNRREYHWRQPLNTMMPQGLNVENY